MLYLSKRPCYEEFEYLNILKRDPNFAYIVVRGKWSVVLKWLTIKVPTKYKEKRCGMT